MLCFAKKTYCDKFLCSWHSCRSCWRLQVGLLWHTATKNLAKLGHFGTRCRLLFAFFTVIHVTILCNRWCTRVNWYGTGRSFCTGNDLQIVIYQILLEIVDHICHIQVHVCKVTNFTCSSWFDDNYNTIQIPHFQNFHIPWSSAILAHVIALKLSFRVTCIVAMVHWFG